MGKVGREPSNPCKYWVFTGHFGVSKVAKWPEKVAKCPLFSPSAHFQNTKVAKWPEKVAKCPLFSPSAHFQNTKVARKYDLELPKVGADLTAKTARILF